MSEPKHPTIPARRARFHPGPPPELGRVIHGKEIPSDVALATPLIIRVTEFLQEGNLLAQEFKNKFQMCLEEALRNAIIHGNRRDFSKRVKLMVFVNDTHWGVMVEDEGPGFAGEKVADPIGEENLWGESGRGIRLIEHYMDEVDYYSGGRTLVMAKSL